MFKRSKPPSPTTGAFIAGTWLGATPRPGDEHRVLSAAKELGIGVVAVEAPQSREFAEAAADLGVIVRDDLTLASGHAPRLGWHGGDERDFPEWIRKNRSKAGLITSFGAPSVAANSTLADEAAELAPLRAIDPSGCIAHHTPPDPFPTRSAWAEGTRNYQAMVVRFAVEAMRARRLGPVLGFFHAALLDSDAPVAQPGLLGADLVPKEAFRAFEVANRPRVAIAERLPAHLHGNEALALDITLVNDTLEPIERAQVHCTLVWETGAHEWHRAVRSEALSSGRVDTLQIVVPEVDGPLTLSVDLDIDGNTITSLYTSHIFASPHDH